MATKEYGIRNYVKERISEVIGETGECVSIVADKVLSELSESEYSEYLAYTDIEKRDRSINSIDAAQFIKNIS